MVDYESNIDNFYGCQLLVADLPDTIPLNHVRLGCPTVGAQVQPISSLFVEMVLPNSGLCVALAKTIFSLSGQILTSSKVIPQRRHQLTRTSSDSVTAARVHIFNTHLSYCLSFISTQPSFRPTNPRITIIEILIYKLQTSSSINNFIERHKYSSRGKKGTQQSLYCQDIHQNQKKQN